MEVAAIAFNIWGSSDSFMIQSMNVLERVAGERGETSS
ncbi:hypothetical protein FOPG_09291 [Fusarium oxysporum f. sp. conglutinans race 2 54008]|uniref:Uncharacterized protein n=1 Tax=Fusarium oxysporum f. sp. conglutinans race 2 54008 TaxID=1089457 RepID=X0HGX5_FUSOX|nr:hypothetical protein FOPG_09291 [Fusarium oxysporum f. sp. conglutinans race 2 54008]